VANCVVQLNLVTMMLTFIPLVTLRNLISSLISRKSLRSVLLCCIVGLREMFYLSFWTMTFFRVESKEMEKKSIYIVPFILRIVSKCSDMDHVVLSTNYTMPAFPFVVIWRHP